MISLTAIGIQAHRINWESFSLLWVFGRACKELFKWLVEFTINAFWVKAFLCGKFFSINKAISFLVISLHISSLVESFRAFSFMTYLFLWARSLGWFLGAGCRDVVCFSWNDSCFTNRLLVRGGSFWSSQLASPGRTYTQQVSWGGSPQLFSSGGI